MSVFVWLWRLLTHRHTAEYSVITSVVHQNTNGADVFIGLVRVTSACSCGRVRTRSLNGRRWGAYALAAGDVCAIVRVVQQTVGKHETPQEHNIKEVFHVDA